MPPIQMFAFGGFWPFAFKASAAAASCTFAIKAVFWWFLGVKTSRQLDGPRDDYDRTGWWWLLLLCEERYHRLKALQRWSVEAACALVLIDLRIGILTGKRSSPKKRQLKKALIELKKFSDMERKWKSRSVCNINLLRFDVMIFVVRLSPINISTSNLQLKKMWFCIWVSFTLRIDTFLAFTRVCRDFNARQCQPLFSFHFPESFQ